MKEVKEKYGPESFGLFNHGTPGSHFHHLLRAYGSESNAEPAFANCRGPSYVGLFFQHLVLM